MERTLTSELGHRLGKRVLVKGWLHHYRRLSKVGFLLLRDGSGIAQVVVDDAALDGRLDSLAHESVLELEGTVAARAQAPQGVELTSPEVRVLSAAEEPPLELYRPGLKENLPTILDHAAVSLRHPVRRAAFRLSAGALAGFRSTVMAHGFTEICTPKIVASATEGGANVFQLDYFGRPAFLAQSPQFYKQAMVAVFERVFEVGPVFRAEPHDSTRHLNEFVSLDVEMGFIADHLDVMRVLREVVAGMVEGMRAHAGDALELLGVELPRVPEAIPQVHFSEVRERLGGDEPDLAPAEESRLGDWALAAHGSEFLFVTGYPLHKRPFYTHPDPARPAYSNGFDLIFRGLELVTGGQRLHRFEDYLDALDARGLPREPFEGYLEGFRYGMPPHGGFAIGLERFVARVVGAANLREVTLFPRDLTRLTP